MLNHIDYDEELYNTILTSLSKMSSSMSNNINGSCSNIKSVIDSFYDDYSSESVDNIKSSLSNHVNQIDVIRSNLNHSLLVYQACDNELKESANKLIDSLFDESETLLAKYFKKNIVSMIEVDDNNLMKYKENIDYKLIYENLIPTYQYIDENGNIMYFNNKKILIGTNNDNVKINYGGETFTISFLENNALKLLDSNNNPINIFGEYNIDSLQYGSNQKSFSDNIEQIINDENIIKLLDQYLPDASYDDRKKFLMSISPSGCGYSAMVNAIFKELEGQEDKYLDTFGYPMYDVRLSDNGVTVDFNYEPLFVDLYTYKLEEGVSIDTIVERNEGVYSARVKRIFDRFNDKYHLFEENYEEILERNGYCSDMGFNAYEMDGSPFFIDAGGHVMTKIGEIDDKHWIVSTMGKKIICEINNPNLEWHYDNED